MACEQRTGLAGLGGNLLESATLPFRDLVRAAAMIRGKPSTLERPLAVNAPTRALDLDVPQPALPLARCRVRFREQAPEGAHPLASPRAGCLGSAWRGAFGHALRKTVCVTRLPACGL